MKYIINILALIVFSSSSWAAERQEEVVEVLSHTTYTSDLVVAEDTFEFNVNGYSCQHPGLRILRVLIDNQLNHELHFGHYGSDAHYLAIGIKDPNNHFCLKPGMQQDVFGSEFVFGATLPMTIEKTLDVRLSEFTGMDGKISKTKILKETVLVTVNGRQLESTARVILQKDLK